MCERQRLIHQYINELDSQTSFKVQLFLFMSENDKAIKDLLFNNLNLLADSSKNSHLQEWLAEFSKSKIKKDIDYEKIVSVNEKLTFDNPSDLFDHLYLANAKKAFLSIPNQNASSLLYLAEIFLLFENYSQAYFYGEKILEIQDMSLNDECFLFQAKLIQFLSLVALGKFKSSIDFIDVLIHNTQFKYSMISKIELTRLSFYLMMTISNPIQLEKFYQTLKFTQIAFVTDFSLFDILVNSYINRQYNSILSCLTLIKEDLDMSIYTSKISNLFIDKIISNLLANFIIPFSKIPITYISKEIPLQNYDIIRLLSNLIEEGSLDGKLDLVEMVYTNNETTEEYKYMKDLLYRTINAENGIKMILFRKNYQLTS